MYRKATEYAETSNPKPLINLSAGPFIGAPPTIGLIAIFPALLRLNASLIPFTDRIVPMLTIGLLGQMMTRSLPRIESVTPEAGLAVSAPKNFTPSTLSFACRLTRYSWKCIVPPSVSIHVSNFSSVIGRILTFKPSARHIRSVASDSLSPCLSRLVLCRCVAKSLSPKLNQVS